MTRPDFRTLGRLIDEWRGAREVQPLITELENELAACDEPSVGPTSGKVRGADGTAHSSSSA